MKAKKVKQPKVEFLGKLPAESLKFNKGVVYVILKFKIDKRGNLVPKGHRVLKDQHPLLF